MAVSRKFKYYLASKKRAIMTTQEVADRLVALCRENQNMQAVQELYATNVVSVEPKGAPMELVEGIDAVIGKTEHFFNMVQEFHAGYTTDPVVGGDHFSVAMGMDVTTKEGVRMRLDEIAVYEVKDGKVVREEFFYAPMTLQG